MHLRRHRPEELLGGPDGQHPGRLQRPRVHGGGGAPRPATPPRSSTWPLTQGVRWASTGWRTESTPSSSTTTSPSRPRHIAPSRFSCGGHRAARPTPATCSISLATARARRQALRRIGPGPHRTADHRDQGRRHLRLYPDQRHLHHRRAGLPRVRPLQLGRPPRHQRGELGEPGRQRSPGQGDEEGVGNAQARPGAGPRARGVRDLRLRARQGVPGAAGPGLPADGAPEAAAEPAGPGRGAGPGNLRGNQGWTDTVPVERCSGSPRSSSSTSRGTTRTSSSTSAPREACPTPTSSTRA